MSSRLLLQVQSATDNELESEGESNGNDWTCQLPDKNWALLPIYDRLLFSRACSMTVMTIASVGGFLDMTQAYSESAVLNQTLSES